MRRSPMILAVLVAAASVTLGVSASPRTRPGHTAPGHTAVAAGVPGSASAGGRSGATKSGAAATEPTAPNADAPARGTPATHPSATRTPAPMSLPSVPARAGDSAVALPVPAAPSAAVAPAGPVNATTAQGLWWGVDSTSPISDATVANVAYWYRGNPTPSVWGRYLTGSFALRPGELAVAAQHNIYVYLLVPDANCSGCTGGDVCGNDRTAAQAEADATAAVAAAERDRIPGGAVLYKDIEEVGACDGELTSDYLLAWYRTASRSNYRVGFYGNTYRQTNDFPRAYCAAITALPSFAQNVLLADNEPEPQLGAPQGTVGPSNAPPFAPYEPWCAPSGATRVWQYGESVTAANSTDIDLVRPGTPGLIAPDGTVTG